MFFSLFDDCRYKLFIHHRYWITNESFPKYIFNHLHILFSKRYRLTASDRISSLIPIQIPSRIGPVSRIHNPLVFVFFFLTLLMALVALIHNLWFLVFFWIFRILFRRFYLLATFIIIFLRSLNFCNYR